jgi:hypothetical protein
MKVTQRIDPVDEGPSGSAPFPKFSAAILRIRYPTTSGPSCVFRSRSPFQSLHPALRSLRVVLGAKCQAAVMHVGFQAACPVEGPQPNENKGRTSRPPLEIEKKKKSVSDQRHAFRAIRLRKVAGAAIANSSTSPQSPADFAADLVWIFGVTFGVAYVALPRAFSLCFFLCGSVFP